MIREVPTLAQLRAMTPDEAAAFWWTRGRETAPDAALFEAWLADREENAAVWAHAQQVWGDFDRAGDDPVLQAMRSSALALGPGSQRPNWRWVAASVAAVLVTGGVLVGVLVHRGSAPPIVATSGQSDRLTQAGSPDYSTGKGQQLTADLADGTKLTLDTDSAANVAFVAGGRRVRLLRGQAFFEVAHDPSRPFSVEASGIVVTDVGTQFDVRLDPDSSSVTLLQGLVTVAQAGAPRGSGGVELHPGEQFTTGRSGPGLVAKVNVDDAVAWRAGYVEFRNETLGAAAAELNRYSRIQILIQDPRVASLRISGRFKTGDVRRFCRTVALIQPVRAVQRSAGQIELIAVQP